MPSSVSVSDYLLVPMGVQAVVVNTPVLANVPFVSGAFDYEKVPRFQTPAPTPFNDLGVPPEKGVHLLWEMPAALRQGTQTETTLEFSLVPNRWLVVRYWPGQSTADRQMKAWVVQSDYLGADGSNSFLDPSAMTPTPTKLGKSCGLSDFSEPGSSLFLRSIAPGNVTFTSARMNAQNVFALCDDLADVTLPAGQTIYLTYLVVGWYSDATQDPLHGVSDAASWAARTAEMRWLTDPSPYAVAGASPPQKAFGVTGYGDLSSQFPAGAMFTVTGSTDNDGSYTVAAGGPVWDPSLGHMTIPVEAAMTSSTVDGYLVPPGAPSAWPAQTLVHGLLYNVGWQDSTLPPRPNRVSADIAANVKIAVGNSAIDALGAMIIAEAQADEGESAEEAQADAAALEAFQANLLNVLDQAGGQAQLDQDLRSKWFSPQEGGTLWEIVTNPNWQTAGGNPPPDTAQKQWLAALNYYQQGLDRETRVLVSMQYELYALWWRTQSINAGSYVKPACYSTQLWYQGIPNRQPPIPPVKDQVTASLPTEAGAVYAQEQTVAAWQAKVSALAAAPPSYVSGEITVSIQRPGTDPVPAPPLLLKAAKMGRFYGGADPVVLISGLGASLDLAEPSQAGQDSLACRLGSQCITALTVDGTAIETSSLAAHVPTPAGQNLPAGIVAASVALALEAVLLDPDNASLLAQISGQPSADIATAIRLGNAYTGLAPAPLAASPWEQAWVPIFLDWSVVWYPTVSASVIAAGNTPNWAFDRGNWAFDGLDYQWTGGDVSNPVVGPATESYLIASADPVAGSYTISGSGNLGWWFPSASFGNASFFNVSGTNGTYQVQNTACDAAGDFTVFVVAGSGIVTAGQAGQRITPQVLPGWNGGVTFTGRTFLTPSATFNFRARLKQYLATHGGRYTVVNADPDTRTFTVGTPVDLSAYFPPAKTIYVAQSSANNGTYRVVSSAFDAGRSTFAMVVAESFTSAVADGVVVADPLADAAHLLDIIGGARYAIVGIDSPARSVTVSTPIDLNHLFGVGSAFDLAETASSNGTYTVASTSYDEGAATLTVVAVEPVPASATVAGVAVPQSQGWDLLSQSLSGFTQQLLMHDPEPNQIPTGTVPSGPAQGQTYSGLVGDQDHLLPLLTLGDAVNPALGNPPPYYFPVRGGFFALRALTLVDRFGQSIDLMFANGNNVQADPQNAWLTFGPIRSRWVTPEAETRMSHPSRLIKQPPRTGQPGRLDFRFISAPDTATGTVPPDTDIDLVAGANPVAGWVLPNHLDNGLLVYDADGNSLGELVLSQTGTTPASTVRWFPVPMAATPIVDPTDPTDGIPNQYLRGFVAGILGLDPAEQGDAFANFLQTVDETLWAVDPLGGRSDTSLSVLVGRPLALVRAGVKLVTSGLPTADQSTCFSVPNPYGITAVDVQAGSFGVAMTVNLAETGRFERGATVTVVGSSGGGDGVYTIARTTFDGTALFTVCVEEPIPSGTSGGTINPRPPEGGLTGLDFTLRLGRADLYDDGLIGYYVGNDYSRCYNVHALDDNSPAGYLYPIGQDGRNYLSVSYRGECSEGAPPSAPVLGADSQSVFLTMLIDPRGTVNATTGILPTEQLTLPAEFYQGPVAKLEIYFRTGPLLVAPEAIRMPRPTEQQGTWNWIQRNTTGSTPAAWEADPIAESDDRARFPASPLQLRDGWLKLTGADLEG